jgi:hypothetical protein
MRVGLIMAAEIRKANIRITNLDEVLPVIAKYRGYLFEWWETDFSWAPVLLFDGDHNLVWRWDDTPTLGEVFEVCGAFDLI